MPEFRAGSIARRNVVDDDHRIFRDGGAPMHRSRGLGDRLNGAIATLAIFGVKAFIREILEGGSTRRARPRLAFVPVIQYKKCCTLAGRGVR